MKYHLLDLKEKDLAELFLEAGVVESKNEARRLMKQGGLKVDDYTIGPGHVGLMGMVVPQEFQVLLKKGKRKSNWKPITVITEGMYMVPL
jgi:tyrosyl-tRNA synthetase